MEKKKYYNANLERILKKYITAERYGDFAPLLEEVFQRRAYEFVFSERTIEAEVQNFTKNVETISMCNQNEMFEREQYAEFDVKSKRIKINLDFMQKQLQSYESSHKDSADNAFECITFCVYQAINHVPETDKQVSYEQLNFSRIMPDIIMETAANRVSKSRGFIDAEQYSSETVRNPNISFASNLLAASIGVSEKEMLTIGIQIGDSSNRIFQFVNSKISRDIVNSYSVYEHSLKRIYIQMLYGSILQNPIDTKRAVSELFISAYEMASSQISLDNSPFSRGTVSEIEYRIRKMEVLINNALNRFSEPTGIITAEDADEISKSLIQFKQRLINQRDGIRVIQVQGESIPDKDYMELSKLARTGEIFNDNRFKKLKLPESSVTIDEFGKATKDLTFATHVLNEDFDFGRIWDNTNMRGLIAHIYNNEFQARNMGKMLIETSDESIQIYSPATKTLNTNNKRR